MPDRGAARVRAAWRDGRDWLVASDPGLTRLRTAGSGAIAMGTTLGVEWLLAHLTAADAKQQLVGMLLGAIVAIMGAMGLTNTPARRDQAVTALFLPVAIGLGMALGAAVVGHHDLLLAGFVAVMFVAVYVRRFGPRFFFYGFLAWMGYFFASFLGATFGALPDLVVATSVAAAWVWLLTTSVLRQRPDRALARSEGAFQARARAVADAAYDVLVEPAGPRARHRLRTQVARLTEAALMVEAQLGEPGVTVERGSASALRRWLVDCELAMTEVARATELYAASRPPAGQPTELARQVTYRLGDGDDRRAEHAAHALLDGADAATPPELQRLAAAALDYLEQVRSRPAGDADSEEEFEAAVSLRLGYLPSSAATATDVAPRSRDWNPLARLSLTTRQAIQVAVAGSAAIIAGRALSDTRYYWAVIAAFVVFSGTATRSETIIKGMARVSGTVAGLGAAIVLANATAGNTDAVLATILVSMFLGYYLMRLSYGLMIFFITIVVAQLYSVLHEFSDHLLFLRLEETAVGAAIGIVVAVFFLPVSTRDTARAARSAFYCALHDLLQALAQRLETGATTTDLEAAARGVDAQLHQLGQVVKPMTRRYLPGADSADVAHRITIYGAAAADARAAVAALRRAPVPVEAGSLAAGVRILADACARLADDDSDGLAERLDQVRERLDQPSLEGARGPVRRALSRLVRALRQLNGLPVDADPPRRPVPVSR